MVKLLAAIGLMIGFIELAPASIQTMMMDTASPAADTGHLGADTGAASGPGPDTGSTDTGTTEEDTGLDPESDTGSDNEATLKYSASELAGESGGCSATGTPNGPWYVALFALVGLRSRRLTRPSN